MKRTPIYLTAAAIAVSLGVTACSVIAAPTARTGAASAARGTARGAAAAALHRLPPSGPGATAKRLAPPVVGVNLYVDQNYSKAQIEDFGARDLKYIARTLKLKAVSIAFDYNVPNRYSDTVTASASRTPTMADLAALTSIARSYGLRVEYRALFAVDNSDSRAGSIQPRNLNAWLRSLLAAQTPALRLAQREHVSEFIAGTEMASIDQSPLWGGYFTKAARLYHGILSYASWGGRAGAGFFSPRRQLLPLRYYGASAYPPINLPPTASVARLTQAWVAFLRQAPERLLHLTAIDELGIPEVAGAYRDPYQWDGLGHPRPDPVIQANWYKAACQAADLVHVRAIYFWSAALSSDPTNPWPSLVGFEGHPATEAAIKSCS